MTPFLPKKLLQTSQLSNISSVQDAVKTQSDTEFDWIFWSFALITAVISGGGFAWWINQLVAHHFVAQCSELAKPNSSPQPLPGLIQDIDDEVQIAQIVRQVAIRDDDQGFQHWMLGSEYFPVTQRQMKRSWRYLNRPVRTGLRTELDVEATVHQIGQQGFLLEPVLVPRRVNRAELLLLIDQEGSMVPFHSLRQRLTGTASRGGRLGNAGTYYFHNCPMDYLYRDPVHQEAELVSDILSGLTPNRVGILIFSDAGAARGGINPERIELTAAFLQGLKQKVRYVAWLNPVPRSRWTRTTAVAIGQFVPMFEVSRQGMDGAIDVLRGRNIQV